MEAENQQQNSQQVHRQQIPNKVISPEQRQINLSIMSDPSLLLYNSLMEGKNEMTYKVKLFYSTGASQTVLLRDEQK